MIPPQHRITRLEYRYDDPGWGRSCWEFEIDGTAYWMYPSDDYPDDIVVCHRGSSVELRTYVNSVREAFKKARAKLDKA